MENIDALLRSSVRVDAATNKGSVLDLLQVMTGQTSSDCSKALKRLQIQYPDLGANCPHVEINGSKKLSPVADAATLVEIVFVVGSCCFLLEMRKSASLHQQCMTSRLPAAVRREEGQELQEGSRGDPVPSPARGPDSGGRDPAAPCRRPGHRPGDFPGGAGGGSRRGHGHPGKGRRQSSSRRTCVSSSAFPSERFSHLRCAPQDAPTDIHSEEERRLVSSERHLAISERHLAISERQSELSERRKQQVSEEIALSERYQQTVSAELALSERRKQQLAEEIAQSERYQQVMSAEMAQAERYRRQQEENVPICHQYLDMAREKTSLLKQSTELRYDGLRADYTPSPDEFTFWDACVLAASILTADYQVYAEPFDVWSFCSESNWFCNKAGCVRLWGPDTYRP